MPGASRIDVSRATGRLLSFSSRPVTKIGVIGVFNQGRFGSAHEDADYRSWQAEFGGFSASAQQGPLAVRQLFAESFGDGGNAASAVRVYTVRVAHLASVGDINSRTSVAASVTLLTAALAATKGRVLGSVVGPFDLDPGNYVGSFSQTLKVKVDGGSATTATFTAGAASRESSTGTFNITNGQTCTINDGGGVKTKTFLTADNEFADYSAVTVDELYASLNAFIAANAIAASAVLSSGGTKVTVRTTKRGSGATLTIGGTATLGFTSGATTGSGNVADVHAVTVAEVKTIVELAESDCTVNNVGGAVAIDTNTLGSGGSIQVDATSTLETIFGLDTTIHTGTDSGAVDTLQVDAVSEGEWANPYRVKPAAPSNGVSGQFNLQVLKGTVVVETFTNLSMVSTDPNYVVTVVNSGSGAQAASQYIRVTDLEADVASPDNIPAAGTFDLDGDTAGANGLGSLADADYVGGVNASGKTAGLSCFDAIPDLDVIIAPDRSTASFIASLISYNNSRALPAHLIFELPHGATYAATRTFVRTTAALIGSTERASAYWPEVYVDNPDTTVFGNAATVIAPVSGLVAGLFARVDASRDGGAAQSPAGTTKRLRTARALASDDIKNPTVRGLVYDDLINPIMVAQVGPNAGAIYVDGAKTLNEAGAFPWVGQSRGIAFLEKQIHVALDAVRHENNTEALRSAVKAQIEDYLRGLLRNDFFASRTEALAFAVDVSNGLNPLAEQAAGRLNVKVDAAMAAPGEFITLTFSPLVGQAA